MNLKYLKRTVFLLPITSLSLMPLNTWASFLEDINLDHWGVGFTLDTSQYEYKGNSKSDISTHVTGSLHPEYHGERFNINYLGLSYALFKTDEYHADILLQSKTRGYEAGDSHILKGMDDRDRSLDAGFSFTAKIPYSQVSLSATTDISNRHKGQEMSLKLGGTAWEDRVWTGTRSISLTPVAGFVWQSKKVVDYYYGVKNKEATATRQAYHAKSTTTPFIGFEIQAQLSEHFSAQGGFIYQYLQNEIKNSPLTRDGNNNYLLNLGLSYWF